MNKIVKRETKGITLIALVITIIVLLILAGISISMLSGDNSILQKATDAKQISERSEAKEQARIDIMAWITDKIANNQNSTLDDAKVKEILTGKSYVKNGQPGNESFITAKGEYEILYSELYEAPEEPETPSVADRTGINIGDYVTYTPPIRTAYKLYESVSGYGTDSNNSEEYQEIQQEYTRWRVLNINDDGSMDLVAAVILPNNAISFKNALGWNNAVWSLDDICKTLYEVPNTNSSKAITARSVDIEDVTDHMIKNAQGKVQKIEDYKSAQMSNLTVTSGKGTKNSDGTVTYTSNTWYPLLYPKQANESDPYYSSATSEGRAATKPSSLTVEYTYYIGTIEKTDFTDYNNTTTKSRVYDALFTTGKKYWLASRSVLCDSDNANFRLRNVDGSTLSSVFLFDSRHYTNSNAFKVRPVVTLGSNVQVTPSTDNTDYHEDSPHAVIIPSN